MTTPRQHSERQSDQAAQPAEPTAIPEDQVAPEATPATAGDESATGSKHAEVPPAGAADTGRDDALFGEEALSELRARWNDVQAAFVDDPRECVQKADGLVSVAVERLTTGFSETRSRLEEQWSRGEEASTEDLRIALKRYRDFFERLLAV